MERQRPLKSVEQLYGSKFEAPKSQVTTNTNSGLKNGKTTERDAGYIITSNTPYYSSRHPATAGSNLAKDTPRHKNARNSMKTTSDKYGAKPKEPMEDSKKELNIKMKTSRDISAGKGGKKCSYSAQAVPINLYDEQTYGNYNDTKYKDTNAAGDSVSQQQQHHHHRYHHHHNHNIDNYHHASHEDDKDDADEFFELIRQTVVNAIGKSISELLNRNFRELATKMECLSAELQNTNVLLNKMQTDMNNKIVHYGEENSRHFRYLCMKSEYDKMFYQHQSMIAGVAPATTNPMYNRHKPDKHKSWPKNNNNNGDKPCSSCRISNSKTAATKTKEPQKVSSDEIISPRSSEKGMREVIKDIKRFCNRMQQNDFKYDQLDASTKSRKCGMYPLEDVININKEIFEADDLDLSSDGMSPRSDEQSLHNHGSTTMRSCSTNRGANNDRGDA